MQDMRDVVHELVVNQLGVKRAAYLGHSLGGQLVMGYALTWPEAVQDVPAGDHPRRRPFDEPGIAGTLRRLFWSLVWRTVAGKRLSSNGRTIAQAVVMILSAILVKTGLIARLRGAILLLAKTCWPPPMRHSHSSPKQFSERA
jgi:pimeloyl-ACP methyl ester carboxylesterase